MEDRSREKVRNQRIMSNWEIRVKNLPENFYKDDLVHYLWKSLDSCRGLIKPGNPIISSELIKEQCNILVMHFRSFEEATNCLFLDRLYYVYQPQKRVKNKYLQMPPAPTININKLKIVSRKTFDDFNKIYVGNFPSLPDFIIMNYLSEYGQLKSFVEIEKDGSSSQCFCEYAENEELQETIKKLNSLKIKGRPIIAKRAALMNTAETNRTKITSKIMSNPTNTVKSSRFEKDLNQFYATFDTQGYFLSKKISCVLLLKDIIPSSSINQTKNIIGDILKQVQRIGPLVKIAHKNANVYVEYERVEYSQIAYLLLSTRKYDGKSIQISFYDPIKFADDILL